jgi:prepilin-type N-terminal cleavage/methylation domain-containing protein
MICNRSKAGFTLIEMMVVIAIISLLASIILVGVDQARVTARNAQRMQQVSDYKVALELVYDAKGYFPGTFGNPFNYACLGTYASGHCWAGLMSEVPAIDSALAPYIPSPAPYPDVGLSGFDGILYTSIGSTVTPDYDLTWILEGVNRDCYPGRQQNPDYLGKGITYCEFERTPPAGS